MSISIDIKELYGHPRFYEIIEEIANLHNVKNRDYASREEPLANFIRVGRLCKDYKLVTSDREALKVCLIYMMKQLDAVLKLIMTSEKGNVEGVPERLKDVAVYSIIAQILYEENK